MEMRSTMLPGPRQLLRQLRTAHTCGGSSGVRATSPAPLAAAARLLGRRAEIVIVSAAAARQAAGVAAGAAAPPPPAPLAALGAVHVVRVPLLETSGSEFEL